MKKSALAKNPQQRLSAKELKAIIEVKMFFFILNHHVFQFFTNCFFFYSTKNPRPISAADLPKTTLNKNFQEKRQENYQKDIERDKKEMLLKLENEKYQRENEEMKKQLSKLATASASPNLQVN